MSGASLMAVKGGQVMLRVAFCSVAVLAISTGILVADDNKGVHAMFVKADMAKNTVTFKTVDKAGKNVEKTLALARDAKILGEDNKPETFAVFAKNLQTEKDKSILVVQDQAGRYIVEIKDLRGRK
jgi:hypothetical protein